MKLIELLKLIGKSNYVYLGIEVCGIQFESRHTVGFFIDNADDLNDREVLGAYSAEGDYHIMLEK